ncbi:MAG: helix-turn-helix domain-containing protein [Bacteroidales bacterium]
MSRKNLTEYLDRIENLLLGKKSVLTLEEACLYTGFKKTYMYKLTALRLIPHSKPNGKSIFFNRSKLDLWLLENECKIKADIEREAMLSLESKKGGVR